MDGRTYYMILGVSRTETPSGIRSAYRDLARKLHPDVAGKETTHAFQEITEAYDVLSDPERRRAYNDELQRAEGGGVVPVRVGAPAPPRRAPASTFGAGALGIPQSQHLEALNIEVLLTPEEGRRGCELSIGVPGLRRCPDCGGAGRDWLFPCFTCGQQGTVDEEQVLCVRIPPRPRSGSMFEIPLRHLGIHNFCLRLRIFVEADATRAQYVRTSSPP